MASSSVSQPDSARGTASTGPTASISAEISISAGGTICEPSPRIDLVPVVLGWIVGCGHHDTRVDAEIADREGQHRRREWSGEYHRPHAGCHHHGARVVGELVGLVASIEPDDHARAAMRPQVGDKSGRRLDDHHPVHPVWPCTERSAQPSGPELQPAREAVAEVGKRNRVVGLGSLDQPGQFGAGVGIRVIGQPGARFVEHICHRWFTFTSSAAGTANGPPTWRLSIRSASLSSVASTAAA